MSKFLYYPVGKPRQVNQQFGAINPSYQANGINIVGHNGVDFGVRHADPIYASHDGIALYEIDGNQGHGVVLRSTTPEIIDGKLQHYKTIYWHMVDPKVEPQHESPVFRSPNLVCKAGDLLGWADSTGFSTGDHLHFGFKTIALNEDNGAWYNLNQDNGYMGAISPESYWNGYYAQDAQSIIGILSRVVGLLGEVILKIKK